MIEGVVCVLPFKSPLRVMDKVNEISSSLYIIKND